jgi:hypothetical protein
VRQCARNHINSVTGRARGEPTARSHERIAARAQPRAARDDQKRSHRADGQQADGDQGRPGDTTLRARLLGTRLREKREAAGLKLVAAATLNKRRAATLSRWETGERMPHPSELFYALEVYGVRDAEREELMRIAEEAYDQPESPASARPPSPTTTGSCVARAG